MDPMLWLLPRELGGLNLDASPGAVRWVHNMLGAAPVLSDVTSCVTLETLKRLAAKSLAEQVVVRRLFHAWPLCLLCPGPPTSPSPRSSLAISTQLLIPSSLCQLRAPLPSGSPIYCQALPFEVRRKKKKKHESRNLISFFFHFCRHKFSPFSTERGGQRLSGERVLRWDRQGAPIPGG